MRSEPFCFCKRDYCITNGFCNNILERLRLEQICPPDLKAILRGTPMPPPQQMQQPSLPSEATTQETQQVSLPADPSVAA
jgi:hypothetical protein